MSTYFRDEQPNSPGTMSGRRLTGRNTNRYSVSHYFSVAAEQDMEVQDELARGKRFTQSFYSSFFVAICCVTALPWSTAITDIVCGN